VRLAGKVAVVTGGARGIGRATVEAFVREGAAVAVGDIRDAAEAVASATAHGGQAFYLPTDAADEDSFDNLLAAAATRYGGIDVVVNNAGVHLGGPVTDVSVADFDRIMAVNVRSVFLGCKLSLPHLRRRQGGSVVSMSSNGGIIGRPGDPVYNASKHAIVGLTRSLALAHAAEGIRFNAVCPGAVDTDMLWGDAVSPEDRAALLPRVLASAPMPRAATAAEVAAAVVFLASDESRTVTGIALPVDGGKSAGVLPLDRYRLDFPLL
jgi:NAD(P)-dependent dehydrogenase (short-subunit alcohol dehydrogenase family)